MTTTSGRIRFMRWIDRVWQVTLVAVWRGMRAPGIALTSLPDDHGAPLRELARTCERMHEQSMTGIARQIRGLQSGTGGGDCCSVSARLTGSRLATLTVLEALQPALGGMAAPGEDETRERIFGRCFSDRR